MISVYVEIIIESIRREIVTSKFHLQASELIKSKMNKNLINVANGYLGVGNKFLEGRESWPFVNKQNSHPLYFSSYLLLTSALYIYIYIYIFTWSAVTGNFIHFLK